MDAGRDLALTIALLCAYLVVVVLMVMPSSHWCHDPTCERLRKEKGGDRPK